MKRVLIGALLASLAMFFWGFLFWAASPLPAQFLKVVPDERALAEKLREAIPEDGVFMLPNMGPGVSQEEWAKRHAEGPLAQITFVRNGVVPMTGGMFAAGWLHMFVTSLLLGWILLSVPGPTTFGSRFCILALAASVAAVGSNLGRPIWWYQPWGFHALYAVYDLTSLLLAAAILAWYLKPAR
jgi:hypothetical protein